MQAALRSVGSSARAALRPMSRGYAAEVAKAAETAKPAEEPLMKIENLKDYTSYMGDYLQTWALFPLGIGELMH